MTKQRKRQSQRPKYAVGQNGTAAVISSGHTLVSEQAKGPVLTIKYKYLALVAYAYMVLPIFIFLVSWLRWYIGIPAAAILLIGFLSLLKTHYWQNQDVIKLPLKAFFLICCIFLIWTWISGVGGFFFQTSDMPWRNATFRDLINYNWPVIYPSTNNGLVYYLLFWIVPALFGKIFGWTVGNVILLLWTFVGIMIAYLLIVNLHKRITMQSLLVICIVFILWSGLNTVGLAITNILHVSDNAYGLYSAEPWLNYSHNGYIYNYLYRSNFESLSFVFNQTIVPWVAIGLLMNNKSVSTFIFLGLCVLPFAPLPFIGFLPLLLILAITWALKQIKQKNIKGIIPELFSIPNLFASITIFPVFFLYFKSNVAYASGAGESSFGLYVPWQAFDFRRIVLLSLFYLLEFGVVSIIIYPRIKNRTLFFTVVLSLILIPLFKVGTGRDFCMGASIPILFLLMVFVIEFIFGDFKTFLSRNKDEMGKNFLLSSRGFILIIVLTLSSLSPLGDVASRLYSFVDTRTFPIVSDSIRTFSNKNIGDTATGIGNLLLENYLVPNPETKAFYKYLARTDSKE